ncbi:Uncharacterised protein [Mycobacteroides abscessus subsp. abscessus]|nr:Uncharacterised protein [Mycobacteroides abscessus subsp. abscessus]
MSVSRVDMKIFDSPASISASASSGGFTYVNRGSFNGGHREWIRAPYKPRVSSNGAHVVNVMTWFSLAYESS